MKSDINLYKNINNIEDIHIQKRSLMYENIDLYKTRVKLIVKIFENKKTDKFSILTTIILYILRNIDDIIYYLDNINK